MRPTCMNHEPMVFRLLQVVIIQIQGEVLVDWANRLQSTTISQFHSVANVWSPCLLSSNTGSTPPGCKPLAMSIIMCRNFHWIQNIRRKKICTPPSTICQGQEDLKSKKLRFLLLKETEIPWLLIYTPRKRSCETSIQFVCQEQAQEAKSSEIQKRTGL